MSTADIDIKALMSRLHLYAREKGLITVTDEVTQPIIEALRGKVEEFREKLGLRCVANFQGHPDKDTPEEVRQMFQGYLFYRAQLTLDRDGRPFSRSYTMNVHPEWDKPIEGGHILYDFLQECRGGVMGIENIVPMVADFMEPATLEWHRRDRARLLKKAKGLLGEHFDEFMNLGLPEGTYGQEEEDNRD